MAEPENKVLSGAKPDAPVPMTAQSIYKKLESERWMSLQRARDCSALTLPGLLPPQFNVEQTELPTPYQSVGARGVNNLAAKVLMALLPPGSPFFRLQIREEVANQLGTSLGDIQQKLAGVERTVNDAVEMHQTRPVLAEVVKHLIVAGNALLHVPSHKHMRMFRMDQYVIVRDSMQRPIHCVVFEQTIAEAIKPEVAVACRVSKADCYAKIDIYTKIEWDYVTNQQCYWQEINDCKVPGSDGNRPIDKAEWIPLRWVTVPNHSYGRGHCEEYLGDLRSLEGLSEALYQFAQAAAKIVLLVHPNSTTSVTEINKAESGDAVVGSLADIDMLQLQKQQDFQVTKLQADAIEQRLSRAFLLTSGTTRDAERVTAEEIRANAEELENALGGVYTVLSHELQLPLVRCFMASMTKDGEIPALPKKALDPVIVTGFEALGRNHELNRLRSFMADLTSAFGQEYLTTRVNFLEWQKRFATGYGIEKPADLWLTDEQVQQQQNQQQMAGMAQSAAPQIAKAIGDHVNQNS